MDEKEKVDQEVFEKNPIGFKWVYVGLGIIAFFVFVQMSLSSSKETVGSQNNTFKTPSPRNNTVAAVAPKTDSPSTATAKPTQLYKVNETAIADKFNFTVTKADIASEIVGKYSKLTTENQFVILQVKVSNNDEKPRDISTNIFTLYDSTGKSYKAASISMDGEYLVYETVNPGLSRTKYIAFETAKGVSGFKLDCDSGVLLAGGKHVQIDLGK